MALPKPEQVLSVDRKHLKMIEQARSDAICKKRALEFPLKTSMQKLAKKMASGKFEKLKGDAILVKVTVRDVTNTASFVEALKNKIADEGKWVVTDVKQKTWTAKRMAEPFLFLVALPIVPLVLYDCSKTVTFWLTLAAASC